MSALDLPSLVLLAVSMWPVVPREVESDIKGAKLDLSAAIHAVKHCLIGLLPPSRKRVHFCK